LAYIPKEGFLKEVVQQFIFVADPEFGKGCNFLKWFMNKKGSGNCGEGSSNSI